MSYYNKALRLASMGFHVFPLRPNTKLPAIKNFPKLASRDPNQIRKWWINDISGLEQEFNIGISTSNFKDGKALVVVDVDDKNGKKGSSLVVEYEMQGKEFPSTFEQITTTKGQHLVFVADQAIKQGTDVLGVGLDIRSRGGYIVASGSTIDGKVYKDNGATVITQCPQWIIDECGKAIEPTEDKKKGKKYQATEYDIERAIFYLENEAPESIKGQAGDQTAYRVAAKVKDFGISKEHCLELMMTHWFDGSGWSPEKLKLKIDHAYHYGKEAEGSSSTSAEFKKVETETKKEKFYLEKLNDEYALVFTGGSHSIIHETLDEKGRPTINLMSEASFKRKFSNKSVGKDSFAEVWLDWPGRREYAGLFFAPEREIRNNYYNTWRGFTCSPKPYEDADPKARKGFDMFIEHARQNVCQNDESLFNWIITYFAHMIQRPYERPQTSIVFHGEKGVGKNALVDRIGGLLGHDNYLVTHDGRYLMSSFNGHMESCLCMVFDEAFWSGDKSAEGKLKGLITSPEVLIERKGKEAYKADNLVRTIIIGNESWLVPASVDERRFAVFEIGNGRKQQNDWFFEMRDLVDNHGGKEILLHFLQTWDLNRADITIIPKTEGLLEQKVKSMGVIERFWFTALNDAELAGSPWPDKISKKDLRLAVTHFCREANIKTWIPDEREVGKIIKKYCPSMSGNKKMTIGDERVNAYRLPTLEQARIEWELAIGQSVEWDNTIEESIFG